VHLFGAVTDVIGRIAERLQQIAAVTAEQARGSELVMKWSDPGRSRPAAGGA
jgi:methyl-accepting chemotaxis protein